MNSTNKSFNYNARMLNEENKYVVEMKVGMTMKKEFSFNDKTE